MLLKFKKSEDGDDEGDSVGDGDCDDHNDNSGVSDNEDGEH